MKTQLSHTTATNRDPINPGSLKGRPHRTARAALALAVIFSLSACDVYPGGMGYGSGYNPGYNTGLSRYANAYSGFLRPTGQSYGGYNSRGYAGRGSRHSSSYGVQHIFGQSFTRPGHSGYGGGFGGSRSFGGFGGGHGAYRGRH